MRGRKKKKKADGELDRATGSRRCGEEARERFSKHRINKAAWKKPTRPGFRTAPHAALSVKDLQTDNG